MRQIDDIFLIFPRKQALTFHAYYFWNVKAYFLWKISKHISNCLLLKFFPAQSINSFPASGDFRHLLITFANSLDPDQARQNIRPDLDQNCLTLWWYSWKIFLKSKIKKKKNPQKTKKEHAKLSSMKRVKLMLRCVDICKVCWFVCLSWEFYGPVNTVKVMLSQSFNLPSLSWASLVLEAVNQYFVLKLSPVTDNCPSWISRRGECM